MRLGVKFNKKGLTDCILCKPFKFMARPEGFEPPAYGFEEKTFEFPTSTEDASFI
jgi:hypothetical protein